MFSISGSFVKRLSLAGLGLFILLACSLFGGAGGDGDPTTTNQAPEITAEIVATPTHTPIPQPVETEPPEPPEPPEEQGCPDGPAIFGLQANHHFWTPTGMGDWVWEASGYLQVVLDENGQVSDTSPQVIPGSQSGEFASESTHCTFTAPAEVNINIHGACVDGVLQLEIWESWSMGTYDWVCDEDQIQFDLPEDMMPPAIHPVQFTLGAPASYIFEVPFGGGEGVKTYTLQP